MDSLFVLAVQGKVRELKRPEVESVIEGRDALQSTAALSPDAVSCDGVKAILFAGCNRHGLTPDLHFIPPENIQPQDFICKAHGDLKHIDSQPVLSASIPLSVTQAWWLRKERSRVSESLLRFGACLKFDRRTMNVYARDQVLLRLSLDDIAKIMSDFVDVKLKVEKVDDQVCDILSNAESAGCVALWHDGVLEVQGALDNIERIIKHSRLPISIIPVKLIGIQSAAVREFVGGKKDGKINKIVRDTGTKVDLVAHGPHFINVVVQSGNLTRVVDAYMAVLDELPAELACFIPEPEHRRLIGHGGKNIQRIMKRHAVYMKFAGRTDAEAEWGTPLAFGRPECIPAPNTVIRTPAKNKAVLPAAIMDVIEECESTPPDQSIQLKECENVDALWDKITLAKRAHFQDGRWFIASWEGSAEQPESADSSWVTTTESVKEIENSDSFHTAHSHTSFEDEFQVSRPRSKSLSELYAIFTPFNPSINYDMPSDSTDQRIDSPRRLRSFSLDDPFPEMRVQVMGIAAMEPIAPPSTSTSSTEKQKAMDGDGNGLDGSILQLIWNNGRRSSLTAFQL